MSNHNQITFTICHQPISGFKNVSLFSTRFDETIDLYMYLYDKIVSLEQYGNSITFIGVAISQDTIDIEYIPKLCKLFGFAANHTMLFSRGDFNQTTTDTLTTKICNILNDLTAEENKKLGEHYLTLIAAERLFQFYL